MSDATDSAFVQDFLHEQLPPDAFRHRDHLRLAWCLARERGGEEAMRALTTGIRRLARRHGHEEKYHETLTRFWVRLVSHQIDARSDLGDFAAFLVAFPQLLDKDLPYRHWRRATLDEARARGEWVEPDLLALPD